MSVAANATVLALLLAGYWFVGSTVRTENSAAGGTVTRSLATPTLIVFQVLFYALILLFVASVILTAIRVARTLRVDPRIAVVLALFMLGLLAYPFAGLSSVMSACALGEGFPLGTNCD